MGISILRDACSRFSSFAANSSIPSLAAPLTKSNAKFNAGQVATEQAEKAFRAIYDAPYKLYLSAAETVDAGKPLSADQKKALQQQLDIGLAWLNNHPDQFDKFRRGRQKDFLQLLGYLKTLVEFPGLSRHTKSLDAYLLQRETGQPPTWQKTSVPAASKNSAFKLVTLGGNEWYQLPGPFNINTSATLADPGKPAYIRVEAINSRINLQLSGGAAANERADNQVAITGLGNVVNARQSTGPIEFNSDTQTYSVLDKLLPWTEQRRPMAFRTRNNRMIGGKSNDIYNAKGSDEIVTGGGNDLLILKDTPDNLKNAATKQEFIERAAKSIADGLQNQWKVDGGGSLTILAYFLSRFGNGINPNDQNDVEALQVALKKYGVSRERYPNVRIVTKNYPGDIVEFFDGGNTGKAAL
ncbi:hypothetical protein SAMN06265795_103285 [Noviherbaspirillum humi]|uniref:Uncharacterized protein n=1 Tax=Noviherbaspirillum humi TaxID=1688639 RepID=A0A239FE17_9BURK|nr:hypothetical protein [Noviherbaspirillum humi]SNS54314.1 hypothetical protein SAMN06265795_103285 [Noviherbaspirillum humi]